MKRTNRRCTVASVIALVTLSIMTVFATAQTARADGWLSAGSMSTSRQAHTSTLLSDGRVLVVGGYGISSSLASAEVYNPTTNSWSSAGSMSIGRYFFTATLLGDGRVLVTGGESPSDLDSAEIYDPISNRWSSAHSMSTTRYGHTATLLPDGRVLVAGGIGGGSNVSLASAEVYDPTTDSWSSTGSMITGHVRHTATLLSDGHVLIAGGYNVTSAETYNPSTNSWSPVGLMSTPHAYHTANLLSDGRALVTGGLAGTAIQAVASAEIYDPLTNLWSLAASMSTARLTHIGILMLDGRVLVSGGFTGSPGDTLGSAEIYNPSTDSWSPTDTMSTVRSYHTANLLLDGSVLVAGGADTNGVSLASAEIFSAQGNQIITFAPLSDKTFGASSFTVSATASSGLAVTFSAVGSCSVSGNTVSIIQTGSCTITASQAGNLFFSPAPNVSRSFNILKATPTITWNNPADITYGTTLSGTQLNATASVAGTFAYTPAIGTALNGGSGQTLSVLFTPTDSNNYSNASSSVTINVLRVTPTVSVTGGIFSFDGNSHGATGFAYGQGGVSDVLSPAVTFSYVGTGSTTYGPTATAPTNAGTYTATASFAGNTNYTSASNSTSLTITAVVMDTTPPVLTLPANITASATSSLGAVVTFTATANDAVDGPVPVSCTPASGATFPIGTTTVNCSATDTSGNTATGSFNVTVQVTTADQSYLLVATNGTAGIVGRYAYETGSFLGNVVPRNAGTNIVEGLTVGPDGNLYVSDYGAGSGAIQRYAQNGTYLGAFTPVMPCPLGSVFGPDGNLYVATCTGHFVARFDGTTGAFIDYFVPPASGGLNYPYGVAFGPDGNLYVGSTGTSQVLRYRAADGAFMGVFANVVGMRAGWQEGIGFGPDNHLYVASTETGTIQRFNGTTGAFMGYFATGLTFPTVFAWGPDGHLYVAEDDVTGVVKRFNGTTGAFMDVVVASGLAYTYGIAFSGAPASSDAMPPVLTLPGNITAEATSAAGAVVTFTATANDAVDGPRPVTCTPSSGSIFPLGVTTVMCSASDTRGNTATGSFTVTVRDTTSPVLTLPNTLTVQATSASGAVVTFTAGANDAVDGPVPVICTPASGSTFPIGTTTVNCSASDSHGNTATGSFTVTVNLASAASLIGSVVSISHRFPDLNMFFDGPYNVTVAAGTSDRKVLTPFLSGIPGYGVDVDAASIHIDFIASVDFSPSTFHGAVVDGLYSASPGAVITGVGVTSSINFDPSRVTFGDHVIRVNFGGLYIPQGTTFDLTLQTNSLGQDTIPPVLNLPSNITTGATDSSGAVVAFTATANDAVDGPVPVSCTPASGSTFSIGTTTVNCSASDSHGNTANGSFSVTVNAVAPTISVNNIPTNAVDGGSFTPTYSYNGDGTTSVTSNTPTTCSVVGANVNFVGAGTCTLVAHATAGANYAAADGSPQSFTIGQDAPGDWSLVAPMSNDRYAHAAVLLDSGEVLVTGGNGGPPGTPTNNFPPIEAEKYNPLTNTWSSAGTMVVWRSNHTATKLCDRDPRDPDQICSDGRVLVAGGYIGGSDTNAVEIYNPSTNNWSPAASMSTTRDNHTATLLSDGRVLITGGSNFITGRLQSAEIYDPTTNTWSPPCSVSPVASCVPDMSTTRNQHAATLLADGRVLVTGGGTSFGSGALASAEIYNPAANSWSAAAPMSVARYGHTSTALNDGRVLVTGGNSPGLSLASAEIYNPATNSWSPPCSVSPATSCIPDMSVGRLKHTATSLSDGRVLIAGGFNGRVAELYLASAEIYDPTNGWTVVDNMSTGRSEHTATRLLDGSVLVAGGLGDGASAEIFSLQAPQIITVTQNAPASAAYNTMFNVAATGGASGNPVTIAASGACSGSGNDSAIITMTSGTGNCTVTFNQAGNVAYLAAPTVTQTTTALQAPTANLVITTGTSGTNSWYTSDVTVSTMGTDANGPVTCTGPQVFTSETAGIQVSGSCTNGAGITTYAVPLTLKIDKTPPSATLAVTVGTLGADGWYTSDVTVTTTGTDSISSVVTCTEPQTFMTDTPATIVNGSCTNDAGLTTEAAALAIKIDKTSPSAALVVTSGAVGLNGWYRSDVTVTTQGTDSLSSVRCTASQTFTSETAGTPVNGSCTDDAGLTTNASPLTIMIDKTPTTVNITSPTNGAVYLINSTVRAFYSCSDNLSGIVFCQGNVPISFPIDTSSAGSKTFTVNTVDRAGNTASQIVTYSVIALAPDLIETAVSTQTTMAAAGDNLYVTDTVKNQGNANAAASITRYYLSLTQQKDSSAISLIGSRSVDPLTTTGSSSTSKGTVQVTIPSGTPAGTYYLLACANEESPPVSESNYANNCVASTGTLQIVLPDLVEAALSNPPTVARPGDVFSVTDTVKNQGLVPAGASTTQYYLSVNGQKSGAILPSIGSRSVGPLSSGGATSTSKGGANVTINSSTPLGTYFLVACADDVSPFVTESDETNNCIASSSTVLVTLPDLVEVAVKNPPVSASVGSSITVTDIVQNQSQIAAATSLTGLYLSLKPLKDDAAIQIASHTVQSLKAGATVQVNTTLKIPAIPAGNYYLLACADATGIITESNEANNCRAATATVNVTNK